MTKKPQQRSAIAAMYTGLGLTVIATIVPYLDRATTAAGAWLGRRGALPGRTPGGGVVVETGIKRGFALVR